MKLKLLNIIVLLATLLIVLWALFNLELWAKEWKDLFFYQDNWLMFGFVLVMVFAVGMIIKKLFVAEYKMLK